MANKYPKLLFETVGGVQTFRGPLAKRLHLISTCRNTVDRTEGRQQGRGSKLGPDDHDDIVEIYKWGVFSQTTIATILNISRITVGLHLRKAGLVGKGIPKPRTLRGSVTRGSFVLLHTALKHQRAGQPVHWPTVAASMVEDGSSPNTALALCGLHGLGKRPRKKGEAEPTPEQIAKYDNLVEQEEEEQDGTDDLLDDVRPDDEGHSEEGEGSVGDQDEDQVGDGPEPSEEEPEPDQSGQLRGAAERDPDPDPSPVEDEAERPKHGLLDPAELEGAELIAALEAGTAWYPEVRNPVDESGDAYLRGLPKPPPGGFMAED
jgi:hypothetical protein